MSGDVAEHVRAFSTWVLPILLAVTLHEAAHGFAAWRLGDDTARAQGRMTLNPLAHVDPFGTVLLPGMLLLLGGPLFGWAKPVPVNFGRLHNPKRDMIWVAAAGPATNIVLAFASALLLHVVAVAPGWTAEWLARNLVNSLQINIILALFNMLPIPPLDGGRIVTGLLPTRYAVPFAGIERYGLLILMLALFVVPFLSAQLGSPFSPFSTILLPPANFLLDLIARLTGTA